MVPMKPATNGVRGRVVTASGRSALLDAAVAHHDHAVGQRQRLVLAVGDEQGGDAEPALDVAHLLAQPLAQVRRRARERLVEQQDLGLEHERAGDRDPLLLAARELARVARAQAGEADELEHCVDLFADRAPGQAAQLQAEGDVARTPSCGSRARGSGTPCRSGASRAARRSSSSPSISDAAAARALEAADHAAARWTCRSRRGRAGRRTRRRSTASETSATAGRGAKNLRDSPRARGRTCAGGLRRRGPRPACGCRAPAGRSRAATSDGTQSSTESTAPYWTTSWLLTSEIISTGMVRTVGAPISRRPSVS